MAVIVDRGMRDMVTEPRDVSYYVALMNENYPQPFLPPGAEDGVVRGGYCFAKRGDGEPQVTLMGSGARRNFIPFLQAEAKLYRSIIKQSNIKPE